MSLFGKREPPPVAAQLRRCDLDLSASLEPMWQRIAETIAWCRLGLDPRQPQRCLRREETRPRVLERDYFTAVSSVASARRNRSGGGQERSSLVGGRVLVYFPDDDLADGAAEAESEGFFDVQNAPPWDTWLAMAEDADRSEKNPYLIAWVPEEFRHLAQRGIDANPEECILWLNDCDVAMRSILRNPRAYGGGGRGTDRP